MVSTEGVGMDDASVMTNAMPQARDGKGAPAQESCTGTWLVSPATGCQKKKKTPLEQGLRTQN